MKITTTIIASLLTFYCFSQKHSILLITETAGWNHHTKQATISLFDSLAKEQSFALLVCDSSDTHINANVLSQINIIVLANTTANIFKEDEERQIEQFVENGGNILGIHAASDTEYKWAWYMQSIGAHFITHAKDGERNATMLLEDTTHPAILPFLENNNINEEWYTFNISPREDVIVLASLEESTYIKDSLEEGWFSQKLSMGDHPIIWYNEVGKGKVFYTGLGHNPETYQKPYFIEHISGIIQWLLN